MKLLKRENLPVRFKWSRVVHNVAMAWIPVLLISTQFGTSNLFKSGHLSLIFSNPISLRVEQLSIDIS